MRYSRLRERARGAAGAIRSRSSSDTGNIGETRRVWAPERCPAAVAMACSTSPATTTGVGSSSGASRLGGRPEEDDEACGPPSLGAGLLEQTLLLGRRMHGEADARELTARDEHDRVCPDAPEASRRSWRASRPSRRRRARRRLAARRRARAGRAGGAARARSGSRRRRSPTATAASTACRRGRSRPAGSGSALLLPTPPRRRPTPPRSERAFADLGVAENPSPPARRHGGDRRPRPRRPRSRPRHRRPTAPRSDRLLGRPVALERAVELEVVGPEARDRGDRRAVRREAEVRARQLEHDHAGGRCRRAARPSARGSRHERSCSRAPPTPAARRSWARSERRRRLAGGARDADRRHPRTLEHEVAEAADASARRAEPRDARRDLRRPDVEERLVVLTRVAVEVGVLANLDVEGAERERLGPSPGPSRRP